MRQHLPGLNALRAVAALVVVTVHLEMEKSHRSIPNVLNDPAWWVPDHHLGVVLFFVLSGFIITWLLVREREATGAIDLRAFYMRRVLRIWPVYYLVLLVSALLFPFQAGWDTVLLCATMFPNIAKAFGIGWQASPQVWSIGVEEQFYLFWPLIMLLLPLRRLVPALLVFFVGWSLLPFLVDHALRDVPVGVGWRNVWWKFFYGAKFNAMALGCVMGYLFAVRHAALGWLSDKVVAYASVVAAFGLWFTGTMLPWFHDEFYSVLFALVVLNAASGRYPGFLDRGPLEFMGRISYGIYMYHWIVLLAVMSTLDHTQGLARYNILLYGGVLGLTVLVSWLSYIGPERYFQRMKSRFARV